MFGLNFVKNLFKMSEMLLSLVLIRTYNQLEIPLLLGRLSKQFNSN